MKKYFCKKCKLMYKTKKGLKEHIKKQHSLQSLFNKYKWILTILGILVSLFIFYQSYKPDLQVTRISTDWNNLTYTYEITNFGRSTAKNVEVTLDLDYWKGQRIQIREFPPGEITPLNFKAAIGETFLKEVSDILKGDKAAIAHITIKYRWLGIPFKKEYTGVHSSYYASIYLDN